MAHQPAAVTPHFIVHVSHSFCLTALWTVELFWWKQQEQKKWRNYTGCYLSNFCKFPLPRSWPNLFSKGGFLPPSIPFPCSLLRVRGCRGGPFNFPPPPPLPSVQWCVLKTYNYAPDVTWPRERNFEGGDFRLEARFLALRFSLVNGSPTLEIHHKHFVPNSEGRINWTWTQGH